MPRPRTRSSRARLAAGLVAALAWTGAALAEEPPLDLVILIDAAESAGEHVGVDVDGDGVVGGARKGLFGRERDPDDTVLGVQVAAVKRLLRVLDPSTRVCVVAVAGDGDPFTPDARALEGATHDFGSVERALDSLLESGTAGRANWVQGLLTGTVEALGTLSARSARREEARRRIAFIAASPPGLPLGPVVQSAAMAARAAARGSKHGILYDVFAVGPDVEVFSRGLELMAVDSGGWYVRVEDPAQLLEALPARYARTD